MGVIVDIPGSNASRRDWSEKWRELIEAYLDGKAVKFGGVDSPEGRMTYDDVYVMRNGFTNRARSNYLILRSRWDKKDGSVMFWLDKPVGGRSKTDEELRASADRAAAELTLTRDSSRRVIVDEEHPLFKGRGTDAERGVDAVHPLYIPPGSTIPKELADMLNRPAGTDEPTKS